MALRAGREPLGGLMLSCQSSDSDEAWASVREDTQNPGEDDTYDRPAWSTVMETADFRLISRPYDLGINRRAAGRG